MASFRLKPPLFNFAYHPVNWLREIAERAQEEPWGKDLKVLELYLRANFELAKAQTAEGGTKVYEDQNKGIAFWRAGHLVNRTADPIWLVYEPNKQRENPWRLRDVRVGDVPVPGIQASSYEIDYTPPPFDKTWELYFYQYSLEHMLEDTDNRERLERVFDGIFKAGSLNEHIVFRTVYAEIELKRKQEVVIPQWYMGDYQFLMPLFLTQGKKVELTAALRPEPALKRYSVRTLLLPTYAYASARAVVKSRAAFADWMMLTEEDLEEPFEDEEEPKKP
jgi:Domain of unknown function (DUF3825)